MDFSSLPLLPFQLIIEEAVAASRIDKALRLRLVSKSFDAEVQRALYRSDAVSDIKHDWRLRYMGRPFLTKLLITRTRLDRHARLPATRLIGQVLDLLESLDDEPLTDEQRDDYTAALCEALAWSNSARKQADGVLSLLRAESSNTSTHSPAEPASLPGPTQATPHSAHSTAYSKALSPRDLLQGALVAAVATADAARVHLLLDRGADIHDNTSSSSSKSSLAAAAAPFGSPLASAARRGLNPTLSSILASHAPPVTPASSPASFSPIIDAAAAGNVAMLEHILVSADFSVKADDSVRTLENGFERALRFAIGAEHTRVVTLLLDKLDEIDIQGPSRFRRAVDDWQKGVRQLAFLDACRYGRDEMVRLLLQRGADINVCMGPRGTGLHCASRGGHVGTLRLLLDLGAQQVRTYGGSQKTFPTLVQPMCREPICLAARHDHKDVVQFWLDEGVDIDNRDGMFSPLLEAAFEDQISMVRFLLARGADLISKDCGRQALHYAVGQGFESMVQLLIEHGVSPDGLPANGDVPSDDDSETDSEGYSDSDIPMLQAMIRGQDHIVRLLIRLGAKMVDPADTDYAERFKEGFYPRTRAYASLPVGMRGIRY